MDTLLIIGRLDALDKGLAEHFHSDGLQVFSTDDPEEGLQFCREQKPLLVFVEVDSPDQDNFDLLPRLREILDRDGRIVAVCNRYNERLDDYCEQLGANFALPQIQERSHFALFVRGLMSLMPPRSQRSREPLPAIA